jgi:hypothetical protein
MERHIKPATAYADDVTVVQKSSQDATPVTRASIEYNTEASKERISKHKQAESTTSWGMGHSSKHTGYNIHY